MAHIVFVGPLPPPLHGMAAVNSQVVSALKVRADTIAIAVGPSVDVRGLRYHLSKARSALLAVPQLMKAKVIGARVMYASVDDGWGGLWTVTFAIVGRALGFRIYLHHHSYRYILARSPLISTLVRVAGDGACHVVLCEQMAAELSRVYSHARKIFVAPNAVMEPPFADTASLHRPSESTITIGLLSNLTFEKGVDEFVAILEWAVKKGLDVRGSLAGPAACPSVRAFLEIKCSELGERLEWLGAVDGQAKEAFYADVDLFVFPTKYRTESFGLVLLEALVRGVPVIAAQRGCISLFANLEAADVVPLREDFQAKARDAIQGYCDDPQTLLSLQDRARDQGLRLNRSHSLAQQALVKLMVDAANENSRSDLSR